MNITELKTILEKHLHWINEDCVGWEKMRANLFGADLFGANLTGANLFGADLFEANLTGANLTGAQIDVALINKFYPLCCPEYGAFIAWKKANGMIVKLQIPEDAKRSSAFGRKCRASKAVCLAIENSDGTPSDATSIPSGYDDSFIYTVGATVEVENFDDERTHECAPGIHFFITRQEAVDY